MNVYLKYLSLALILILLSSFTVNKINDLNSNPNLIIKVNTFSHSEVFNQLINHCIDRIEHHFRGKYSKGVRKKTIIVEGMEAGSNQKVIKYFALEVDETLEENDSEDKAYEKINILSPDIKIDEKIFYLTQPIKRISKDGTEELSEIVQVSNIRLDDAQCELTIENFEELNDTLVVAYYENATWNEKKVSLNYHQISDEKNNKFIYRSFVKPKINDRLSYDDEPFQINGKNDTILVYNWANTDGYPHVLDKNQKDHYDPQGCGN